MQFGSPEFTPQVHHYSQAKPILKLDMIVDLPRVFGGFRSRSDPAALYCHFPTLVACSYSIRTSARDVTHGTCQQSTTQEMVDSAFRLRIDDHRLQHGYVIKPA